MVILNKYKIAENEIGESGLEICPPEGFNNEKFERGRKFMADNILPIALGMFISLVCGLSISNLLEPLIFTGYSDTPKKSFKRYEGTFVHVARWCYGNIWNKNDIAHRSIRYVRNLHNKVRKDMMLYESINGRCGDNQTQDDRQVRMRLSQYEMSVVQSGFFAPVVLYPTFLGIKCDKQDLDDFVYFWYGVGYALGITDQNNICSHGYEHARQFCSEAAQDILLPALRNPPKDFPKMAKALCDGANSIFTFPFRTFFSWESLVAMGMFGLRERLPSLSLADYIRFYSIRLWICVIYYVPCYKRFASKLFRKVYWENPIMYKKYKM